MQSPEIQGDNVRSFYTIPQRESSPLRGLSLLVSLGPSWTSTMLKQPGKDTVIPCEVTACGLDLMAWIVSVISFNDTSGSGGSKNWTCLYTLNVEWGVGCFVPTGWFTLMELERWCKRSVAQSWQWWMSWWHHSTPLSSQRYTFTSPLVPLLHPNPPLLHHPHLHHLPHHRFHQS